MRREWRANTARERRKKKCGKIFLTSSNANDQIIYLFSYAFFVSSSESRRRDDDAVTFADSFNQQAKTSIRQRWDYDFDLFTSSYRRRQMMSRNDRRRVTPFNLWLLSLNIVLIADQCEIIVEAIFSFLCSTKIIISSDDCNRRAPDKESRCERYWNCRHELCHWPAPKWIHSMRSCVRQFWIAERKVETKIIIKSDKYISIYCLFFVVSLRPSSSSYPVHCHRHRL